MRKLEDLAHTVSGIDRLAETGAKPHEIAAQVDIDLQGALYVGRQRALRIYAIRTHQKLPQHERDFQTVKIAPGDEAVIEAYTMAWLDGCLTGAGGKWRE